MKNVILCEGLNDTILLDHVSKKLNFDQNKLKIFIQKSGDTPRQKNHEESNVLRSFFGTWSTHEVLVKAEGGKDMVVDAFAFFMSYLFGMTEKTVLNKLVLIVDLGIGIDTPEVGVNNFISKLKLVVGSRKGKNLDIKHEVIWKDKCLITSKISVIIITGPDTFEELGNFLLTAFNRSLEDETEIHDSDTVGVKEAKIVELLKNDVVVDYFSYMFK